MPPMVRKVRAGRSPMRLNVEYSVGSVEPYLELSTGNGEDQRMNTHKGKKLPTNWEEKIEWQKNLEAKYVFILDIT